MFSATDKQRGHQDGDGGQLPKNAEQVMVGNVDRNERENTREIGDANVDCHSYRLHIKGETSLNFTTTGFDSFEITEALCGRKLCFVRRHALPDVCARSLLQVEAQLCLDVVRDFIGMPPGMNKVS